MAADTRPDRDRTASAPPAGGDAELIADANAPPDLDQARESLAFWEGRLAGSHALQRSRRREAKRMVAEWTGRVREAERARYGPRPLDQLLAALGISRLPGRELVGVAKKMFVFVAVLLVVLVAATIAFWPEVESVLRDLIQLGGSGGGD